MPGATTIARHEASLARADAREDCRIPVERIEASLLMLTGGAEGIWPSAFMADRIAERIGPPGPGREILHVNEPDAGHPVHLLFRSTDRILMAALIRLFGGSYVQNRAAQKRNWPKILGFFERHLKSSKAPEA